MSTTRGQRFRTFYRTAIVPVLKWLDSAFFRVFQVAIIAAALVIAYFHAFPTQIHAKDLDYPIIDTVTLGCLGVILVAILLPKISEITIGGTSLKLTEAQAGAEDVRSTLEDVANLAQNWSTSIGILADELDGASSDEQDRLIKQYYRDRIGEACEFLTEDPDDVARVALWMYNDSTKMIEYVWSNNFVPTRTSWAVGEGMIGKSFEEGRAYNDSDVRTLPCYEPTRTSDPPYRAVLVHPVYLGKEKLGMITVDKREAELFGPVAFDVAKGLSAQCAVAYDLWRKT
jgi:hypothetical protein